MNRHRWLLAILLLAVLLRVGVALYLGDALTETRGGTYDQISYDALAQRVSAGHGFSFAENHWPYARANQPTAFWSYLYTLYLAGVYAVAGHSPLMARLLQAVVTGILTSWLLYRIGRRCFSPRVGLLTALLAAVYLYLVTYAAALMTEAFYIVGILWTVDVAMRLSERMAAPQAQPPPQLWGLALELGLAMSLTLLLRQVIIVFLAVLVCWLAWIAWRYSRVKQLAGALLVAGLVLVLFLSPFVLRNYRTFGQLAMPNTNAGFTFFWSNHPIYGTRFEAVLSSEHGISYQELIPPELRNLNEAALDRALLQRGLQFVYDDPGRYLLLSLSRIPVYFQFWPTANSTLLSNLARLLSFGLYLPFMLYGLFLALRNLWQGRRFFYKDAVPAPAPNLQSAFVVLFLIFIVSYTALHLASWANVRYRLPVDVFLVLFAAYGLDHLMRRLSRQKVLGWNLDKIGSRNAIQ